MSVKVFSYHLRIKQEASAQAVTFDRFVCSGSGINKQTHSLGVYVNTCTTVVMDTNHSNQKDTTVIF